MFEIVSVLYKELHYHMLKNDPRVSDERLLKAIKRISIKRDLAKISLFYLFFGSFLASGILLTNERALILSTAVTIASLSLIFSLYVTAVNSSHSLPTGLFEPLRILPVRIGATHLSELLLLNTFPTIAIAVPSVTAIAMKNVLAGTMLFLWVLVGIFMGHTLGLLILSTFGLKISHGKTKIQLLRNLVKILGLIAIMSAFYVLNYLERYLAQNFADVFKRYAVVYPFSASSIFEIEKSSILLIGYAFGLTLLYRLSLNRVWEGILEPRMVVGGGVGRFTAGFGGVILALVLKDLRLVFRKTSMLAGLLIPLYFILPQLFMVLRSGSFPKELVIGLLALVSLISTVNADILLRVEGREIEFLRTLPLRKRQFAMGKAISMSVIPVAFSTILVFLGAYFDTLALTFLPHALLMPFNVSLMTMAYLFRYEGDNIGIPERGLLKTIFLLLMNGALVGTIILPLFLLPFLQGLSVSLVIAMVALIAVIAGLQRF